MTYYKIQHFPGDNWIIWEFDDSHNPKCIADCVNGKIYTSNVFQWIYSKYLISAKEISKDEVFLRMI